MGEPIAIMAAGRIEQIGTRREVYTRRAARFVARFLGDVNAFSGVVRQGQVMTPLGPVPADGLPDGQPVDVLVRPEHVTVSATVPGEHSVPVRGVVREVRLLGAITRLRIALPDPAGGSYKVTALQVGTTPSEPGACVAVALDSDRAFVFGRE